MFRILGIPLIVFPPMFKQLDLHKKEAYLERIMSEEIIDKNKVRQYAWCGIPLMYRNKVYRVLLDVCGTDNSKYQNQIIEKNLLYFEEITKLDVKKDSEIGLNQTHTEPGSSEQITSTERSLKNINTFYSTNEVQINLDPKIIKQIQKDVDRIPLEHIRTNNQSLAFIYKNVLKVIAIKNPSIGYVQGMADLLIPFIDIYRNEFFAESTIYFCFSKILSSFDDFFTDGQIGISESIQKIEKVLTVVDPELYHFFKTQGIKIHMFAFRWLNCLFVREFKLKYYRLVLDSMLSTTNYRLFLIYFSISILQKIRVDLLKRNFDEALLYLQQINQIDWKYNDLKMMFANAYVNVNIFEKKFYFDF